MVAVASATDSVQLLRAEGEPSAMLTALASAPPYALSIFLYRRRHFDTVRAEPHTRQGLLMLQRPYFYV